MTANELKARLEEMFLRIADAMPRKDGEDILTASFRSYYSDKNFDEYESLEVCPKADTLWAEITFTVAGENQDEDNTIDASLAFDIKHGEVIQGKDMTPEERIAKHERELSENLFAPLSLCEGREEIGKVIAKKAEEDYKRTIEEYEKTVRGFYKRTLIVSLIALAIIIPLVIIGAKYAF